jgi:hypothetical protein
VWLTVRAGTGVGRASPVTRAAIRIAAATAHNQRATCSAPAIEV